MAHPGGRPALFNSPEEFGQKVDEYFDHVKVSGEPVTITGLCLFLGFESRQSLYDYASKDEFSYITKRAKLMVESEYEKGGLNSKTPAFHIFALKNMGWVDTQAIDHTTKGESITPTPIKFSKGSNE